MIKEIQQPQDLLKFDAGLIISQIGDNKLIPQDEFIRWLNIVNAYWFFDYNGDPKRPHALLTSGNHSDGFVDCLKLLKYPKAMMVVAAQLIKQMRISPDITTHAHAFDMIGWVFGSPMAGVSLAYEVARQLGARAGFTDINPKANPDKPEIPRKLQKRFQIESPHTILLVEELITTLTTASEQKAAIVTTEGEMPNFIPVLGVFFNRSGEISFNGWPIISVVYQKITNFSPDDCPLCNGGSEAIRPKQNWDKLTQSN